MKNKPLKTLKIFVGVLENIQIGLVKKKKKFECILQKISRTQK